MTSAFHLPTWRTIARFGFAHTFFGQLYEDIVDVPTRISESPQTSLSSRRSPTWYFLPVAPLTRLALMIMWRQPDSSVPRPALIGATAAAAVDTFATIYLIKRVNPLLFVAGQQSDPSRRLDLLRRWHRMNRIRLIAEAAGWFALQEQED